MNGDCEDLVNDYRCKCDSGYEGKNCQNDKNDCIPNPCGLRGTCTDLRNGYKCTCKYGWEGKNCEIEIDCGEDNCVNHKCRNGKCVDGFNSYTCDCSNSGF